MNDMSGGIAVVGMGMIGASVALAFRESMPECAVLGVDIDADALRIAQQRGFVTQASLPDDSAFEAFVRKACSLVVLAVPVDAVRSYFEKLADWGFEGIITDTASTKRRICALAQEALGDASRYIPGHPMAGSETNGIEGAKAGLFKGAHWILCPDESTDAAAYTQLHDLLTSLGARVLALPREQHDAAVAIISHVPHIVASSMVQLASQHVDDQGALFRLAAGGFKDSTRVAAGSAQLWTGILLDNAEEVSGSLRELKGVIESFRMAIASGNRELLGLLLAQAAQARQAIPARWVPDTAALYEARIPMQNRQGAVAEITTLASVHGCNIQSIDIDHLTASTAILSLVLTDEGDMKAFADGLRDSGYAVDIGPLTAKEYAHVDE